MMRRSLSVLALVHLCQAGDVLHPALVRFEDLTNGDLHHEAFELALRKDGLIQIAGLPGFAELRAETLRATHMCITVSPHARRHTFADGTVRRTLAAASGVTFGDQPLEPGSDAEACRSLEGSSQRLRQLIGNAADAFARRLDAVLGLTSAQILRRADGGSYANLEEAVRSGERLEHFHSYGVPDANDTGDEEHTLDFHIDQGLFIAFAPAMMVDDSAIPIASLPSGAFIVRTSEGQEFELALHEDALVVLLGDAAGQYMNRAPPGVSLHVPSHAFRMPRGASGFHRVWYGMMQLPPADAVNEEVGLTFGQIRRQLTRAWSLDGPDAEVVLALGCSHTLQARELAEASCADNQLYCWHRCVNFTEEVSPEACSVQNLGFQCVNQFDQVYVSGHGDFHPECTNSTTPVTPRPPVEQPEGCTGFADLISDAAYANRVALVVDQTYFLWNVVDDKIEGKMVHNGLVGWMAMGLENVGGHHNGMNGAHIVMGRNIPGEAPSIGEYQIHPYATAFRNWKTPLNPSDLQDATMEVTDCFSSIAFKTATIYGRPLNVTSDSNIMIWALTHLDYPTDDFGGYSGYHSAADGDRDKRGNHRGHITLDFTPLEVSAAAMLTPLIAASATMLLAICLF